MNHKILSKVMGLTTEPQKGADVTVIVNVTNIVKYVAIAGVAIVGIIFGTKSFIECNKIQKEKEK